MDIVTYDGNNQISIPQPAESGGVTLIADGAAALEFNWTSSTTMTGTYNGLTAGNSLVIGLLWDNQHTISSATLAGAGNTLTAQGSVVDQPTTIALKTQFYTCDDIQTGGNQLITITFDLAPDFGAAYCQELTNTDTAAFVVAATGAAGGPDTTPTVDIDTTGTNNCHIIAVGSSGAGSMSGTGADYTDLNLTEYDWFNFGMRDTDYDAGTGGSKTVDCTVPSSQWNIHAIALKPA